MFDGWPNAEGSTAPDQLASILVSQAGEPLFGKRQQLWVTAESLRVIAPNKARGYLTSMLREEAAMFSSIQPDDHALTALVDGFVASFHAPAFFSNFQLRQDRVSSWSAVTKHSRDSLLIATDAQQVGFWLTSGDE
jgi:hypothetical protein